MVSLAPPIVCPHWLLPLGAAIDESCWSAPLVIPPASQLRKGYSVRDDAAVMEMQSSPSSTTLSPLGKTTFTTVVLHHRTVTDVSPTERPSNAACKQTVQFITTAFLPCGTMAQCGVGPLCCEGPSEASLALIWLTCPRPDSITVCSHQTRNLSPVRVVAVILSRHTS